MADFNERLLKFKEKKGISGDELARLCDIPIDSMRKYLQNKMVPRPGRQEKILKAINKALSKIN